MYTIHETQSQQSPRKKKTFVERVRQSDGSAAHLIKTYDKEDRACWFLLKANERSLVRLEHTSYDDIIDLTQFGEVIASGWGHEPDDAAIKKLNGDNT